MHTGILSEHVLLFCGLKGRGLRRVPVELAENEIQPSFILHQRHVRRTELLDSLLLLQFKNSTFRVFFITTFV